MVAGAATVVAVGDGMQEIAAAPKAASRPQARLSQAMSMSHPRGGHLYMQTNETRNAVIHFRWSANGTLTEVDRMPTGGAGSGELSPIYHINRPNHFEGAGSVILTPDRRFLFTTNGGDNSVSSFSVDKDGRLTLLDVKPTGNPVKGKYKDSAGNLRELSGTAKSLAYAHSTGMLFVVHAFGPDHIRLISVDGEGKLTARPERYTVNTHDKTERVPTMAVLSPDGKFLLVGIALDQPPGQYPDGSQILWVRRPDGTFKVIAANASDPDGLVVFPVDGNGTLGTPSFRDGGGAIPFYIAFLHGRPDTFLIGYGASDGVSIGKLDTNGKTTVSAPVTIDNSAGRPSELCWMSVSPDDRTVYTTNFGYSNISSYRINGKGLEIAKDPASPKVPGDGTYRAINGVVSSGPSDMWLTPDGAYLYQIYGNASKLVGYATRPAGSLKEVSSVTIPYNSPQGLAGF